MSKFRDKFISEALEMCAQKPTRLNAWEQNFVKNIRTIFKKGKELKTSQYNKLHEIYDDIR